MKNFTSHVLERRQTNAETLHQGNEIVWTVFNLCPLIFLQNFIVSFFNFLNRKFVAWPYSPYLSRFSFKDEMYRPGVTQGI